MNRRFWTGHILRAPQAGINSQSRAVNQQLAMTENLIYQHTAKPWMFREQITNEISSTRTSQLSALHVFTSKAPGQENYIQYL
jgi:hypothetical protein